MIHPLLCFLLLLSTTLQATDLLHADLERIIKDNEKTSQRYSYLGTIFGVIGLTNLINNEVNLFRDVNAHSLINHVTNLNFMSGCEHVITTLVYNASIGLALGIALYCWRTSRTHAHHAQQLQQLCNEHESVDKQPTAQSSVAKTYIIFRIKSD